MVDDWWNLNRHFLCGRRLTGRPRESSLAHNRRWWYMYLCHSTLNEIVKADNLHDMTWPKSVCHWTDYKEGHCTTRTWTQRAEAIRNDWPYQSLRDGEKHFLRRLTPSRVPTWSHANSNGETRPLHGHSGTLSMGGRDGETKACFNRGGCLISHIWNRTLFFHVLFCSVQRRERRETGKKEQDFPKWQMTLACGGDCGDERGRDWEWHPHRHHTMNIHGYY